MFIGFLGLRPLIKVCPAVLNLPMVNAGKLLFIRGFKNMKRASKSTTNDEGVGCCGFAPAGFDVLFCGGFGFVATQVLDALDLNAG